MNNHGHEITFRNIEVLTDFTWRIRQALTAAGITGEGGQEIDHIELFAPSTVAGVDSKNFVLCPGKAYDRSPWVQRLDGSAALRLPERLARDESAY